MVRHFSKRKDLSQGVDLKRLRRMPRKVNTLFLTGLPWVLQQSGREQQRYSTGFKYGLAVLLTAVVILIKISVNDFFEIDSPFLLTIIAVVLSALFGGTGPGLLSMALTVLFVQYYYLTLSTDNLVRLVMFLFESLFLILLLDLQRKTQRELTHLNQELEFRVVERTQELEDLNFELNRSNRELNDFAHVASHDLQEPLRKIQAFSDRLEKKLGESLPGDARDYLERMRKASERMRTLIDDLLTFSRVTTRSVPFEMVDLNVVVKGVLEDLEYQIERTEGHLEVQDLPVVDADPLQMRQLFQNLIANALKFHKPGKSPQIKVYVSESADDQFKKIVVEDNGIGFDSKYTDRIFNVFQRLHGKEEYEGTGVGLAVCRKIVERHGGTITAESTLNKGSKFIIVLPVNQVIE